MSNKPSNTSQSTIWTEKQEGFDIKNFLFAYLLRYWYLYLFFIAAAGTLAWLKIRYSIPVYRMQSTLLIKDEGGGGSNGISQEAIIQDLGLMDKGPNLDNEIQILKSRTLMTEVVKDKQLNVSYYAVGRVVKSETYVNPPVKAAVYELKDADRTTTLSLYIQDQQNYYIRKGEDKINGQFGKMLDIPQGKFTFTLNYLPEQAEYLEYEIMFAPIESVASGYASNLSVSQTASYSNVLNLSIDHPVPQKGIDILNTLVEAYNKAALDDKNKVGKNTVQFIDDRLKYLTTELSGVEGDLERYKRQNGIPTEISSSVDVLVEQMSIYDRELSSLEVQKTILRSLSDYLQSQLTGFDPAPVNLIPNNTRVAELITRFNVLVLERGRLLQTATAENPVVQNLTQQINVLRQSILETIQNAQKELELNLVAAKSKDALFQTQMRSIPTKERGLIEIKRQQGIKENLFLFLLQKREETALSLAVAVPNSRIIDPAVVKGGPISPNRRNIYTTFLFIGLLIPSLFVYLKYLLSNTIQSEADIVAMTATPILGSVAYKKTADQIVVKKNSRSAIAEMFRLLRTNLQFLAPGQESQVLLITSSVSGEGKSFITLNMGMTLALADKRTIIIELDLRKPKLIKYLTQQPSPDSGITGYLIGQGTIDKLIHQSDAHPNLYYMASGPIPPNPAELLITGQLEQLILQLRKDFDYILLDTPPVGMVADALLLGRLADCALYVVRFGYTLKGHLEIIEDIYKEQKLPRPAIVFNGVKANSSYGYGQKYGYGYGYGYGYSYGYYDDDKKPWWKFWQKK